MLRDILSGKLGCVSLKPSKSFELSFLPVLARINGAFMGAVYNNSIKTDLFMISGKRKGVQWCGSGGARRLELTMKYFRFSYTTFEVILELVA